MIIEMNEPLNKDVRAFYGVRIEKEKKPPIRHSGRPVSMLKRTKDEMKFYDAYDIFPQNDEQLISFVKSRKAEKGFAKYDRFNRETE